MLIKLVSVNKNFSMSIIPLLSYFYSLKAILKL